MRSERVEFRLLQLLCNPVGDERVTVALIHWDGRQLRFAWNRTKVPHGLAGVRRDIHAVLGSIHRNIRPYISELHLSFGLNHVYPVPEGYGSLLVWTPLKVGTTGDPQAHFAELVSVLDLQVPGVPAEEEPTHRIPKLARQLTIFGAQLVSTMDSAASSRVRLCYTVRGLREYQSPLSWMNGRWHHCYPLNLTNVPEKQIISRYEKALGRIDVSIPLDDVGFIVAVGDSDSELQKRISDIAEFITNRSCGRVDCMSAVVNQHGAPEFGLLGNRVERDVTAAMQGQSNVHKPLGAGDVGFNIGIFGTSRTHPPKLPPKS